MSTSPPLAPLTSNTVRATTIHPTAIVDPSAHIAEGVSIGAYAMVGPHCTLAEGVTLHPHAVLLSHVSVGAHTEVYPHAVLGGPPQDYKFKGETSWVTLGQHNIIREHVTISRATGEGQHTTLGDHNMLMAYAHIGHNSHVASHCILANNVQIAGHCHIEEYATLGGTTVYHQGIRMGAYSMLGGMSASRQDIPPFAMVDGRPCMIYGLNSVGLKRNQFTLADRQALKQAFRVLFFSRLPLPEAVAQTQEQWGDSAPVQRLLAFVTHQPSRGICSAAFDKSANTRTGEET
jgi:UDP-N-acetylglucosamine acyltransferase